MLLTSQQSGERAKYLLCTSPPPPSSPLKDPNRVGGYIYICISIKAILIQREWSEKRDLREIKEEKWRGPTLRHRTGETKRARKKKNLKKKHKIYKNDRDRD